MGDTDGHVKSISTTSLADTAVNHDQGTQSKFSDSATVTSSSPQQSSFVKSPVQAEALHTPPTPDIIPPDHPFRTLVLCFDGTGDQFDADVIISLLRFCNLTRSPPTELKHHPVVHHAQKG